MLKIGLTGGIGSGKSVVARIFSVLGVPVYDADGATKRLYATHTGLQAELKRHFGEAIYSGNTLNRAQLAAIVFNDPEKLALLNSIAHPPTIADAEAWMAAQTVPYAIKEAALLFESGSAAGLDYIIGVDAPLEIRLRRVQQRDGLSVGDVEIRMKRQMDPDEKMKRCDFVIVNDEIQLLLPQVLALHNRLSEMAGLV